MNTDKFIRSVNIAMFIIVAALFISSTGWAATYYVSPQGNDATGDGSQISPWKSLSHACSRVKRFGDTIYINSGAYTDNNTCDLSVGVKIEGAGKELVSINTSAGTYINATSGMPVTDGSNQIFGISFYGTGSNTCMYSEGRSNQEIHDCYFKDFNTAVHILGKRPMRNNCSDNESETATYCEDDFRKSIQPSDTDWAEDVKVYNNTIINAKLNFKTIKRAKIHHNQIDNSASFKSGVGHTAFWWNNVEFYSNTITVQTVAWRTIALEVWMVENNTEFRDNRTNGWFSILLNPNGPNTPYSWKIVNNTFESNVVRGMESRAVDAALETCYHVKNVLIEGNYFVNTGSENTYKMAIGIWGHGENKNFIIRNNVIYNMDWTGVYIQSNDTTKPQFFDGDDIYFYNNVVEFESASDHYGVYIHDGAGDIDNVKVRNNIFMTAHRGAIVYPAGHSVSGVEFVNNDFYNGTGYVYDTGSGGFSMVSNNYTFKPDIQQTGSRPEYYYRAKDSNANIIDAGMDVGFSYSGGAPDIGAYEYFHLSPPKNIHLR
ncbi:hypothetical protein DENIS_4746 [Desulfonema ishimotonii]|uniref:Right handed beta helix domain-containing protein n=1 Tax=Desulfonema ishimotonii TaxID=45657 RepID=A0A401G3C5_9BACT|nr:right-handed parallel beta-helix repeat-containing protein [Desulfonema ishimotonii]GBC63748.1 hypothetical protein DENIS_4746 [Desulfonema ishimotonii]